MNSHNISKKPKNQSGLVSILVTMIIMIVLSLIVIGFSRLVNREQRQSLDRQLSTQAFYAAESGVNDAITKLKTPGTVDMTLDYTDCTGTSDLNFTYKYVLASDLGNNSSYTCLLVDPSPPTLQFTPTQQAPQIFPVTAKTGNVSTITISWQNLNSSSTNIGCPVGNNFPPASGAGAWNCDMPVLRVDFVRGDMATSRNSMLDNDVVLFLYPRDGAGSNPNIDGVAGTNSGNIYDAGCSSTGSPNLCTIQITVTSMPTYYLRIRPIYADAAVTICANSADCTNGVELVGSQVIIDSTGKSVDVLRRVVERISLSTFGGVAGDTPAFGIATYNTICKHFGFFTSAPYGITDVATGSSPNNVCDPTATFP